MQYAPNAKRREKGKREKRREKTHTTQPFPFLQHAHVRARLNSDKAIKAFVQKVKQPATNSPASCIVHRSSSTIQHSHPSLALTQFHCVVPSGIILVSCLHGTQSSSLSGVFVAASFSSSSLTLSSSSSSSSSDESSEEPSDSSVYCGVRSTKPR